METYLIIAVVAAAIGGYLAHEGGRGVAGWALGCFLLPVAVFVLIFLPATGAVCPACAENVKAAARVCKHCGHQFN